LVKALDTPGDKRGWEDLLPKKNKPTSDITADKENDISSDNNNDIITDKTSDNASDKSSDSTSDKTNDSDSVTSSDNNSDIISDIDSAMFKPKKQPKYTDLHERRTHYLTKENVEFIDMLYDKYNQDKSETVNRALLLYREWIKKNRKNGK
jgi:hypothetical protein